MSKQTENHLFDKLLNMHHIVGYHLPISPTNYQVEIKKDINEHSSLNPLQYGHTIIMTSYFDISPKNICGIPFCCLIPLCRKRKHVTDHFYVNDEESTLRLISTSAFGGLISCFEAGKIFQVIQSVAPYLIMVNPKEIFVLSADNKRPSDDEQLCIKEVIGQTYLSIKYL